MVIRLESYKTNSTIISNFLLKQLNMKTILQILIGILIYPFTLFFSITILLAMIKNQGNARYYIELILDLHIVSFTINI